MRSLRRCPLLWTLHQEPLYTIGHLLRLQQRGYRCRVRVTGRLLQRQLCLQQVRSAVFRTRANLYYQHGVLLWRVPPEPLCVFCVQGSGYGLQHGRELLQ